MGNKTGSFWTLRREVMVVEVRADDARILMAGVKMLWWNA